jgi:histidine triad (HIT) family protein
MAKWNLKFWKFLADMDSIFTKIVNCEIPAYRVAEDEHFLAFLDIFPLEPGHTLVIPKKQVDYIFDLDERTYQGLWDFVKGVARAIEGVIPCQRVGIAVVGLEVPHAHVHLIPLRDVGDINFSRPKLKLSPETFQEIASSIRQKLKQA